MITRGKIGVYGPKTRTLQRRLTAETFGLTHKTANVHLYLGSRANVTPHIRDIQNKILFEVPDRAYDPTPIEITIGMEPFVEAAMDFSRFGVISPLSDEQTFRVHLDEFATLGRTIMVHDVFELPFFERDGQKVYWQINDVDDKMRYEKYYVVIKASIVNDSRATREVPIGQSNSDFLDDMMPGQDAAFDEQVSQEGFEDPLNAEEVDYRDEEQASFLDDPNNVFNEE